MSNTFKQTYIKSEESDTLPNLDNLSINLLGENKYSTSFFIDPYAVNFNETLDSMDNNDTRFAVYQIGTYNRKVEVKPFTNCSAIYEEEKYSENHTYLKQNVVISFFDTLFSDKTSSDGTKNALGKKYGEKLINLQNKIGKEGFEKLTFSQQIFMANTFGAINLGDKVNIQSIYENTQDE